MSSIKIKTICLICKTKVEKLNVRNGLAGCRRCQKSVYEGPAPAWLERKKAVADAKKSYKIKQNSF